MTVCFCSRDHLGGGLVQRGHGADGGVDPRGLGLAALDGGRDHAGAERFGEEQRVARLGAAVGKHALRVDSAGDRVAELDFLVADGVAADHGAAGFDHLRKAAGEDALEHLEIAFIGKTDERERAERASAHGVDVAERVDGGDLPEGVGIVHDGGEEIHGLNEGGVGRDQVHPGVVGEIEADQNVGVLLPG